VEVTAAEVLGADVLASGGLHQRRSAEEDRALVADDDALVAHRRHVRAACGARAEHGRDLRDALRREVGLVVEALPEPPHVREQLVLQREVAAARVDEVDAGQAILQRDLLRARVLARRHRVVGAALDRRVVAHDDDLATADAPDACDDPGAGRLVVVHAVRRQRGELEEGRSTVEQALDALARQQLSARDVLLGSLWPTAGHDARELAVEVVAERGVGGLIGLELR
jgi:hypothetical protein